MITFAEMQEIARRPTRERRRAEAMGWTFERIEVVEGVSGCPVLHGRFTCACGAPEGFSFTILPPELDAPRHIIEDYLLDVGARLRCYGSFSREHLLDDGFTEAQVAEFERRGAAFDAANPEPSCPAAVFTRVPPLGTP